VNRYIGPRGQCCKHGRPGRLIGFGRKRVLLSVHCDVLPKYALLVNPSESSPPLREENVETALKRRRFEVDKTVVEVSKGEAKPCCFRAGFRQSDLHKHLRISVQHGVS